MNKHRPKWRPEWREWVSTVDLPSAEEHEHIIINYPNIDGLCGGDRSLYLLISDGYQWIDLAGLIMSLPYSSPAYWAHAPTEKDFHIYNSNYSEEERQDGNSIILVDGELSTCCYDAYTGIVDIHNFPENYKDSIFGKKRKGEETTYYFYRGKIEDAPFDIKHIYNSTIAFPMHCGNVVS